MVCSRAAAWGEGARARLANVVRSGPGRHKAHQRLLLVLDDVEVREGRALLIPFRLDHEEALGSAHSISVSGAGAFARSSPRARRHR